MDVDTGASRGRPSKPTAALTQAVVTGAVLKNNTGRQRVRVPIYLMKLSQTMDTGRIVYWLKQAGDEITEGEVIAEVETDKATVELEAPVSGRLLEPVQASVDVPVGGVIGYIDTQG